MTKCFEIISLIILIHFSTSLQNLKTKMTLVYDIQCDVQVVSFILKKRKNSSFLKSIYYLLIVLLF